MRHIPTNRLCSFLVQIEWRRPVKETRIQFAVEAAFLLATQVGVAGNSEHERL